MNPEEIRKMLEEYQSSRLDNMTDAQLSQLLERQQKAGLVAKQSGRLAKICVNGGLSVVKSGKLAYARSFIKNLPSTTTKIIAINLKTNEEIEFYSQHEASRALKLPVGNINKTLTGERKRAGQYKFIYKQ
jgi:hypothetical protein